MHYFAYGSNMSLRRLCSRVPSANRVGQGVLNQHQLCFHKVGKDSSAKCDVFETGDESHLVYGVVYTIAPHEKPVLDYVEGLGDGYEIKEVTISMGNGYEISAFTYYATHLNPELKPMDWYKQHVVHGALENNFPEWYTRQIAEVDCIDDQDQERKKKELSIYRFDTT